MHPVEQARITCTKHMRMRLCHLHQQQPSNPLPPLSIAFPTNHHLWFFALFSSRILFMNVVPTASSSFALPATILCFAVFQGPLSCMKKQTMSLFPPLHDVMGYEHKIRLVSFLISLSKTAFHFAYICPFSNHECFGVVIARISFNIQASNHEEKMLHNNLHPKA